MTRPSRLMSALCAVSSKRDMVFVSLRVRIEKNWTRVPVVTAKRSDPGEYALAEAGEREILVMGLLDGEGINCWDLKLRQYVCSGVSGEGPGGSLISCNGSTWAAMNFYRCQKGQGIVFILQMFAIERFE